MIEPTLRSAAKKKKKKKGLSRGQEKLLKKLIKPRSAPKALGAPATHTASSQSSTSKLHDEISDFASRALSSAKERQEIANVVARIKTVVQDLWGASADVAVFGSQATGLALPSSDLDLNILNVTQLRGHDSPRHPSRQRVTALLEQLGTVLRGRGLVRAARVIGARIPIIKACDASGRAIDITMGASTGAQPTAEFITSQMDKYPALRPLVIVLKAFLAQQNLNEVYTGGLGSYVLVNLVLAHLQCESGSGPGRASDSTTPDLGHLLVSFLRRFAKLFDPAVDAVSVRRGGIVSLHTLRATGLTAGPARGPAVQGEGRLAVEDPQDSGRDIGYVSFKFPEVQRAFHRAFQSLAPESSPARNPESSPARSPSPPPRAGSGSEPLPLGAGSGIGSGIVGGAAEGRAWGGWMAAEGSAGGSVLGRIVNVEQAVGRLSPAFACVALAAKLGEHWGARGAGRSPQGSREGRACSSPKPLGAAAGGSPHRLVPERRGSPKPESNLGAAGNASSCLDARADMSRCGKSSLSGLGMPGSRSDRAQAQSEAVDRMGNGENREAQKSGQHALEGRENQGRDRKRGTLQSLEGDMLRDAWEANMRSAGLEISWIRGGINDEAVAAMGCGSKVRVVEEGSNKRQKRIRSN